MRDSLDKSILGVILVYFLTQLLVFAAFAAPQGFLLRYGPSFLAVSLGFHLILLTMLFLFKQDFVIEASGERLTRVNAANKITLLRVSTLPTLLILVIAARDYPIKAGLLVLVVLVFATDFADGYISRRRKQATRVGKMMDSASDYSLLVVLTVVFHYFVLIPGWFFALVMARLGIQSALVSVLIVVKKKLDQGSSLLGKAAVASIMVLYASELLRLVLAPTAAWIFGIMEIIAGFIVGLSIADKIWIFCRQIGRNPGNPGRPAAGEQGV